MQFFIYYLSPEKIALDLMLFFISFVGTAAYGFLLNDITDIDEDLQAGKANFAATLKSFRRYLFLFVTIVISILPWFFLHYNIIAISLFTAQIILVSVYSLPPFRIKRFALAGMLTDALYCSLIPAFIALSLFRYHNEIPSKGWILLAVIFIMAFSKGIRNILAHQIADHDIDRNNQLITFAVNRGVHKTQMLINNFLIPLEILSLGVAAYYILSKTGVNLVVLLILIAVSAAYAIYKAPKLNVHQFMHRYLNDIYEDIVPLFFLVLLCLFDLRYILLLAFHVVIFKNKLIYWLLSILVAVIYSFLFRKVLIWLYYKIIWLGLKIYIGLKWIYHTMLSFFVWLGYKMLWLYNYPIKWFYYKPVKWFYYKAFCNRYIKSVFAVFKKNRIIE